MLRKDSLCIQLPGCWNKSAQKGRLVLLHISSKKMHVLVGCFWTELAGKILYRHVCEAFWELRNVPALHWNKALHSQRGFFYEESKGKNLWPGEIRRLNKDMSLAFWHEYECIDCHTCFFHFHWKFLDVRDLCWWTFLLKLVKLLVKRFCEQKSVLFSLPALAWIVSWTRTNCCYFEGC